MLVWSCVLDGGWPCLEKSIRVSVGRSIKMEAEDDMEDAD